MAGVAAAAVVAVAVVAAVVANGAVVWVGAYAFKSCTERFYFHRRRHSIFQHCIFGKKSIFGCCKNASCRVMQKWQRLHSAEV